MEKKLECKQWNQELLNWSEKPKWQDGQEAQQFLKIFNYIGKLLILASVVTECVSIFAFASLVGNLVDFVSSALTSIFFVITAAIKKYKSLIK